MAPTMAARIRTLIGKLRAAFERPIMMRVSIGSCALPRSLYMPAKIGMRNSTMPISTMMAKLPMSTG